MNQDRLRRDDEAGRAPLVDFYTYRYFRSPILPQPSKSNSPSGAVNSPTAVSSSKLYASWTSSYSVKERS
jgi:hypothetical protein